MNKLKEYDKTYFHQCTLCLKEVGKDEEFILTITKGVLKEILHIPVVSINY